MKLPFFHRRKKGNTTVNNTYAWADDYTSPEQSQSTYDSFDELQQTAKQFDHIEFMDTKRAQIALKFVHWYLFYVALVLIGVPLFNAFAVHSNESLDIYKILAQVGTLLGSPLGFVVGYYFKSDK